MKINNPLSKNAFNEFANEHSLLYSAHFEEDAHNIVRGVTLSNTRKDEYLVQGNLEGYETQLLQRKTTLQKPGNERIALKWAILHIDIGRKPNLPHLFLDGMNRYHEDVYDSIFTKFHKLVLVPAPYQNNFTKNYRFFTNPESTTKLTELISIEDTEKLSTLGHFMDYELLDEGIYVYLPGSAEDKNQLQQMFEAGRILAAKFT